MSKGERVRGFILLPIAFLLGVVLVFYSRWGKIFGEQKPADVLGTILSNTSTWIVIGAAALALAAIFLLSAAIFLSESRKRRIGRIVASLLTAALCVFVMFTAILPALNPQEEKPEEPPAGETETVDPEDKWIQVDNLFTLATEDSNWLFTDRWKEYLFEYDDQGNLIEESNKFPESSHESKKAFLDPMPSNAALLFAAVRNNSMFTDIELPERWTELIEETDDEGVWTMNTEGRAIYAAFEAFILKDEVEVFLAEAPDSHYNSYNNNGVVTYYKTGGITGNRTAWVVRYEDESSYQLARCGNPAPVTPPDNPPDEPPPDDPPPPPPPPPPSKNPSLDPQPPADDGGGPNVDPGPGEAQPTEPENPPDEYVPPSEPPPASQPPADPTPPADPSPSTPAPATPPPPDPVPPADPPPNQGGDQPGGELDEPAI